jgi:uncharacterized membrane protein
MKGGLTVKYKAWVWIGGLSSIFFFLPSLAIKIFQFILESSWQIKSIFVYAGLGIILIDLIRHRLLWKRINPETIQEVTPLLIVQRRLAEGKISLDEYRQIKEELQ